MNHRSQGARRLDRRYGKSWSARGGWFGHAGWLAAIAAIALLAASARLGTRDVIGTTSRSAKAQLSDRLETAGEQALAKVYLTEVEWGAYEMSWGVRALPCPGQRYRLLSTSAMIPHDPSGRGEADIVIKSERLASGLRCGSKLPSGAEEGETTVSVYSIGAKAFSESPRRVYEDAGTRIKSFSPCVTLARTCDGDFLLRARLTTPRLAELEYVFTISNSKSSTAAGSVARA
jgi:hypothetical protein